MGDLVVAAGAIAVVLGGLLLGLGGGIKRRIRNFYITFGWLMVIFGLGAEGAALIQAGHSSSAAADAPTQ